MAKIEHKEGATLSHRAELFRSKLIDDFQILESTSEHGKGKVPCYSTTDIISKHLFYTRDILFVQSPINNTVRHCIVGQTALMNHSEGS